MNEPLRVFTINTTDNNIEIHTIIIPTNKIYTLQFEPEMVLLEIMTIIKKSEQAAIA